MDSFCCCLVVHTLCQINVNSKKYGKLKLFSLLHCYHYVNRQVYVSYRCKKGIYSLHVCLKNRLLYYYNLITVVNTDTVEPEVVAFLKKIALSIFISFCWLALNVTVGLRFNLAFVNGSVSLGNILFYIWMTGSFIAMLIFFIRMWKQTTKW